MVTGIIFLKSKFKTPIIDYEWQIIHCKSHRDIAYVIIYFF